MRRSATTTAGALAYLAIAVVAWWDVWTGGVTHTITTSGWGDPAQQIWFIAWVPHAIGSGLNPFVSHAMFAPKGINLMANSSILFPALAVSPITVLFGPIAAFNVAVTLGPAVSAFAAWLVFDRYSTFRGGGWLAGLFYGFSPFVLNDLADGHLHVTLLVFPPLVLALVDDIAVSQRGSPVGRGVLLGLVLAAQALTSLEVLAMVVFMSGAGLVVLAIRYPREVRGRLRRVVTGIVATAVTAGVLLAWPLEVLFLGPRRYHGSVFTSPESYVIWLKALAWPKAGGGALPGVWAAYVGIPILLLVVVGAFLVRNGVLRLAVVLSAIALVLGMGRTLKITPHHSTGVPGPDRLITKMPFLDNMLPVRFMIFFDLFMALGLAIVLGAVWERLRKADDGGRPALRRRVIAGGGAGLIGAAAILSPMLGARWPYHARNVSTPAIYQSAALRTLPKGSVLLAYPVMNGFAADPMIWQATEGFPYEMVAGYGFIPSAGPHPLGSLPPSPVTDLFGFAQLGDLGQTISPALSSAVRVELRSWGVNDIVVLDQGAGAPHLVQILRRVLGKAPRRLDGAWVWLHLPGSE